MSDLEFRRRVMMQFGISGDKWDEFEFGIVTSSKPTQWTPLYMKAVSTPFIEIVPGHTIEWQDGLGPSNSNWQNSFTLHFFDNEKVYKTYNGRTMMPRQITVPNNSVYCRFTVNLDTISSAYLKDVTTGEYLWRGSDYVD